MGDHTSPQKHKYIYYVCTQKQTHKKHKKDAQTKHTQTLMIVLNGKASSWSLRLEDFIISISVRAPASTSPLPTWAFTKMVVVTTSGGIPSPCTHQPKKKKKSVSVGSAEAGCFFFQFSGEGRRGTGGTGGTRLLQPVRARGRFARRSTLGWTKHDSSPSFLRAFGRRDKTN